MDLEALRQHWVEIISGLPRSKAIALNDVLSQPQLRRAFQRLIENAVEIYAAGHSANSHGERNYEVRESGAVYDVNLQERLRYSVSAALSDRMIFPTTNDVIGAVNHFFGTQFEPNRFRKSGRRAVLVQLWKHLQKLSRRERVSKLKKFFETIERMDPHRSYRELFRILSRSE